MSLTNIPWLLFWLIIAGFVLHMFFGSRKRFVAAAPGLRKVKV
jgi:hypothetical protein